MERLYHSFVGRDADPDFAWSGKHANLRKDADPDFAWSGKHPDLRKDADPDFAWSGKHADLRKDADPDFAWSENIPTYEKFAVLTLALILLMYVAGRLPVFCYNPLRMHRLQRVLFFLCLLINFIQREPSAAAAAPARVYGTRPLLSYFALTASLQSPLQAEARLNPAEFAQVHRIAEDESAALRRLLDESASIVSDPALTLEQKRLAIRRMGYNPRVEAIIYASDLALRRGLAPAAYARLVAAIERLWPGEVQKHGSKVHGPTSSAQRLSVLDFGLWTLSLELPPSAPRSYEIFATRYDSKGRYTAALPDQCLKLTNGGHSTCADKGYTVGQTYSIIMSYKKSVGVDVGETGPWNIDDNFWAGAGDPTPRRMFADLAVGMPEAQAAFYNGYNGGVDQYGRKVTAPFAIDLAFKVADHLGIPAKANEWITVSLMWTDGWGVGGGGGSGGGAYVPIETVAAGEDGAIIHEVKEGQSLWAIAVAYGTTIERLQLLNGLVKDSVIVPGQKLTVHPAGPTATAPAPNAATLTAGPGITDPGDNATTGPGGSATLDPSARRTQRAARRTATAVALAPAATEPAAGAAPRVTALSPALSAPPAGSSAETPVVKIDLIPLLIGLTAILGLALVLWGRRLSARTAEDEPDAD